MLSTNLCFFVIIFGLKCFARAGPVQDASRGAVEPGRVQDYALGPTIQLEASKAGPENPRFTASNGAPFDIQSGPKGELHLHDWSGATLRARIRILTERHCKISFLVPGRLLYEPEQLYNELAHFVREKIPDRIVHAKGSECSLISSHVSGFVDADARRRRVGYVHRHDRLCQTIYDDGYVSKW